MFMMMRMKLEVQKNNVHFCEGNRRDSSQIICGLFRKKKVKNTFFSIKK